MAKLIKAMTAFSARMNPQIPGAVDMIGSFDSLIQPMFPYPMLNLSIVITIAEIAKPTIFEMRLNTPGDILMSKGEFTPIVDPFGIGKQIVNLEKVLIKDRGVYSIDLFEKDGEERKFIGSTQLFIAEYPPQRRMSPEVTEEILKNNELIKKVKTEFRPFGKEDKIIKIQFSLNKEEKVAEGYLPCPEEDKLEVDGEVYEVTGLRRQCEWMYGRPIPKKEEEKIEASSEINQTLLS